MVWPTDDLTKTHLDAGTDSPSSARAELEALVDKVKLVLAEVSAGATVWHSGNDGGASGLDADLLDGQHGSYYQDAGNLNAGTISLDRIPATLTGKDADTLDGQHGSHYLAFANMTGTVSNGQLATDSVDQNKISAGAVHQGELDTTQGSEVGGSASGIFTLAGGQYSFYPQTRKAGGSTADCYVAVGGQISAYSQATVVAHRFVDTGTGESLYSQSRYVNSSPPHKINQLDYETFIFLNITKDVGYVAQDPPWYHNGPTNVTPNIKKKDGKKWRYGLLIPYEIRQLKKTDIVSYYKELGKLKPTEYEIDFTIKNMDMTILPHPFISAEPDDVIIIIEPNQGGAYRDLKNIHDSGESVLDLFRRGYLKIDNTEIRTNGKPPGVAMHRIKWKNTK